MTNHTPAPTVRQHGHDAPPFQPGPDPSRPVRKASLIAGIALVIAWLAWRSGYVPKLLGILIGIAGLGYIYDNAGAFLSHGSWTQVSTVTFIGEFLLALWLVIRGRRITVSQPELRAEPTGAAR
jgi:hypothetical protein